MTTKITGRLAVLCFTTLLSLCPGLAANAQRVNNQEDFNLYCSKEAQYYNVQSSDCDRYIQENMSLNGTNSLTQYQQQQDQQSWVDRGASLLEDAKDAFADEKFGKAISLLKSASEAFANGGDYQDSRVANRYAIALNTVCRHDRHALRKEGLDGLLFGTSGYGAVNMISHMFAHRRACH